MRLDLADHLQHFREQFPTLRLPLVRALAFDDHANRLLVATPPALLVFDAHTGARLTEITVSYDPPWVDDSFADEDDGGPSGTEPETQRIGEVCFVPGRADLVAREVITLQSNQGDTCGNLELYRVGESERVAVRPTEEQWQVAMEERYGDAGLTAFAFSPDGSRLAASWAPGEIWVERLGDGALEGALRVEDHPDIVVTGIAWDARGERLAVQFENALAVYDVTDSGLRQVRRVACRNAPDGGVMFGPDGGVWLLGRGEIWRLPARSDAWGKSDVRGARQYWPCAVVNHGERIYWRRAGAGVSASEALRLQRGDGAARRVRNGSTLRGDLDALAVSPDGTRVARASGTTVVLSRMVRRGV